MSAVAVGYVYCLGYIRKILSVHRYETASRLDNVIDFMNSKNIIFTDKLGGEIHSIRSVDLEVVRSATLQSKKPGI